MTTTTHNLTGKVAVMTGGSSGIGFAGAYVFITGCRQDALEAAVTEGVSDLLIPHQIATPKSHSIRALAVGAVEHWRYHRGSLSCGWFCSAQTLVKDSRSTDLKHLQETVARRTTVDKVWCITGAGSGLGAGTARTA